MNFDGKGINKYDGKDWRFYPIIDSLADNNLFQPFYCDENGNCWLVSKNRIVKFNGKEWSAYSMPQIKEFNNRSITCLYFKNNRLWIGTNKGLAFFDGKTVCNYLTSTELDRRDVVAIHIDRLGNLWVGQNGVIYKFDGTIWVKHNYDLYWNSKICSDENGRIWFANQSDNLVQFDGNEWKEYPNSGHPKSRVFAVDKKGVVWLASPSGLMNIK